MEYLVQYLACDGIWEVLYRCDTRQEAQELWDECVADCQADYEHVRILPIKGEG